MVKAIETRYKGYRFRSRLEARWAVFFDTLGLPWEYEKEGYDLGPLGWYLPDFWIPMHASWNKTNLHPDPGFFYEIKGKTPTYLEQLRACLLSYSTYHTTYVLIGPPGQCSGWIGHHEKIIGYRNRDDGQCLDNEFIPEYFWFARCMPLGVTHYDPIFKEAVYASRSARF